MLVDCYRPIRLSSCSTLNNIRDSSIIFCNSSEKLNVKLSADVLSWLCHFSTCFPNMRPHAQPFELVHSLVISVVPERVIWPCWEWKAGGIGHLRDHSLVHLITLPPPTQLHTPFHTLSVNYSLSPSLCLSFLCPLLSVYLSLPSSPSHSLCLPLSVSHSLSASLSLSL